MLQGISGNMQVKPNGAMLQSGKLIAVPVWFTAKTETEIMDLGELNLFEVQDEKIVHVWTFSDDQSVDDEFLESKETKSKRTVG